jgi:hypothetical protein
VRLCTGLVIAFAICVAPRVSAAQRGSLPDRLQAATRASLEALIDSARANGLPVEPLYSKAAEGVIKNAGDSRIVVAVRGLARELGDAREALGRDATQAELVAGASALHAGVHGDALKRMRAARTTSLATALVVLADLITRGVPPDAAASSVENVVARGAKEADLLELRRNVERDIDAGQRPDAALQSRTRGLVQALGSKP